MMLDRVRDLWAERPLLVALAGIAPVAFTITLLVLFLAVGGGDASQTQQQMTSQQALPSDQANVANERSDAVGESSQPDVIAIVRDKQSQQQQRQPQSDSDDAPPAGEQPASSPANAPPSAEQDQAQSVLRAVAGFEVISLNDLTEDDLTPSTLKHGSDGSEGAILPLGNGIVRSSGPRHETRWELIIPSAGLRSSVVALGRTPSGAMGSPDNPYVIGWLDSTTAPGKVGNALLAGHRDYEDVDGNIGTGVCWELNNTDEGDFMLIWDDEQNIYYVYTVTEALTLDPTNPDAARYLRNTDVPVITLITCTGSFNTETHRYSHRLVVVGELAAVAEPDA